MQATMFCGQVGRIRAAVEEEGHDPLGGGQSLQLPDTRATIVEEKVRNVFIGMRILQ